MDDQSTFESAGAAGLQASERRLLEAERLAGLGHWEWDLAADVAICSPGCYRVLGLDPQARPPLDWARANELLHAEDRARVTALVKGSVRSGEGFEYRARFRHADGTYRVVEARGTSEVDRTGRVVRILGTIQDVTQTAAVAAALRESAELLERWFRSSCVGKAVADLNGRYTRVNPAFCELTGYSEAELLQMSIADVTHPDDLAASLEVARRLVSGEQRSRQMEKRYVRKDGGIVWILLSAAAVRNGSPSPSSLIAEVQDITGRKLAEAQLEEKRAHLHTLVSSLDDVVLELDGEGVYVNVWTHDEALLAKPRGELLGRTIEGVLGEGVARPIRDAIGRVLSSRRSETLEYSLDVAAGRRWFSARITPVLRADGTCDSVCMLPRDVSERHRAEQELRDANEQLAAALEDLARAQEQTIRRERLHALGEMAAGITHDFNNALAGILGFAELLLREPGILEDRSRVTAYLELIRTGASDAASVVRRLRDFYRLRDEGADEPVDVNAVVEQAISLTRPRWSNQALASGRIVEIRTELAPVPFALVDPAALREALANLIFNATDAIVGDGTVTLTTRSAGGRVTVAVTDDGCGMSDEVRRRCLEPFFTTKGEEGTGLGLPQIYGLVTRHHGSVDIDSVPGQGTTVTIGLPVAPAHAARSQGRPPVEPACRLRALVVDDEPAVRTVLAKYLELDGHGATTAASADEGARHLAAAPFDLVILDRAMPGMTGDELAPTIAALYPRTAVVLLSGFGDLMLAAGEKPAGVDVVAAKPIGLPALRQAIGKALERAAERAGTRYAAGVSSAA